MIDMELKEMVIKEDSLKIIIEENNQNIYDYLFKNKKFIFIIMRMKMNINMKQMEIVNIFMESFNSINIVIRYLLTVEIMELFEM